VRKSLAVPGSYTDYLGFVNEHALILYVYLSNYDDGAEESVLTVCKLMFTTRSVLTNMVVLHIFF
jgi:hypothetical protein